MDRMLEFAFKTIEEEVLRIFAEIRETGTATRQDWDIVNKLLEVFGERIKSKEEWKQIEKIK